MELIVINERKLKIMLTADDMTQYDINCDTIDGSPSGGCDMRRAFRTVLDDVRERCGFDSTGGRVLIRFFPCREGGCEIFVTRLNELAPLPSEHPDCGDDALVYSFPDIGALLSVCRLLRARGIGNGARAYRGDDGRCAMFLPAEGDADADEALNLAVLDEYGRRENAGAMRLYISEHAVPLCPGDAVRLLSSF